MDEGGLKGTWAVLGEGTWGLGLILQGGGNGAATRGRASYPVSSG